MNPFKVYVAGASAEVVLVATRIDRLLVRGVSITYDWTSSVLEARGAGRQNADLSRAEKLDYAQQERAAIVAADLVWVLAPQFPCSTNALTELGIAIGVGRPTIVSGPSDGWIFAELCERYPEHDHAEARILQLAAWPR